MAPVHHSFQPENNKKTYKKKPWDQWGKPPKQPHHPHHRKKRQVLSLRSNSMVFSIRLYKLMALYVLSTSVKTHRLPGGGIFEKGLGWFCGFFGVFLVVWGESTNISMEYLEGFFWMGCWTHFFHMVRFFLCRIHNIGWRVRNVEGKQTSPAEYCDDSCGH